MTHFHQIHHTVLICCRLQISVGLKKYYRKHTTSERNIEITCSEIGLVFSYSETIKAWCRSPLTTDQNEIKSMVLQCITLVYITPKTHPSGAPKLNKVQRYVRVISDTAIVVCKPFTEMEFIFHSSYVMEPLCPKGPPRCSTCHKHFPISWTITVFITWS